MTRPRGKTRTAALLVVCAWTLLAGSAQSASANLWYVPMTDSELPGGFDHIQILALPGYQFGSPAMSGFSGPDANSQPSAQAEQWKQTFLNPGNTFATADGPAQGYTFLAFPIWVNGNPPLNTSIFHYQTYLGGALVGNYNVICTGYSVATGQSDWATVPGTWGATQTFPPWLPGDANMDTAVDIYDFAIWQLNYTGPGGTGKTWAQGDWNGDGAVDIYDFSLWQQNYTGTGGPSLSQLAVPGGLSAYDLKPVPEPGTLALLALGAGVVALVRRRRKTK